MQLLGPTYSEQEENIIFIMNFENMVKAVRNKKGQHMSDIFINYTGDTSNIPTAMKNGDTFHLKLNGATVELYDLTRTTFNTVNKLAAAINAQNYFSSERAGKNDDSSSLVNFATTSFQNAELNVYSLNYAFQNVTDVIEAGDVILTNKWRLYEVLNANPSGNFAWDWVQYSITCNLVPVDQVNLPGDYTEQIREHQYGVAQRINMEGLR